MVEQVFFIVMFPHPGLLLSELKPQVRTSAVGTAGPGFRDQLTQWRNPHRRNRKPLNTNIWAGKKWSGYDCKIDAFWNGIPNVGIHVKAHTISRTICQSTSQTSRQEIMSEHVRAHANKDVKTRSRTFPSLYDR